MITQLWYQFAHWCRDLRGVERATLLLELVGILVVAAYTTVAALQWCEIRRSNDLARIGLMANLQFGMSPTNWPKGPMSAAMTIRNAAMN